MASIEHAPPVASSLETLGELDARTLHMLGELVVQSGWNQTAADWTLFAAHGTVHAARDDRQNINASGAVLPMGRTAAWISMILVDPAARGQGLGRMVFERCLEQAQRGGRCAFLDATPSGERLYTQYGFTPLWRLTRWQRGARPSATRMETQAPANLDLLAALDAEALGFERAGVLKHLAARTGSRMLRHAQGFALLREGRIARHIGPLIATQESAAAALLSDIASSEPGPVFIDVPDDRPFLREQLAEQGFVPQRGFTRMTLGEPVPHGQPAFIHAIAGPEYG